LAYTESPRQLLRAGVARAEESQKYFGAPVQRQTHFGAARCCAPDTPGAQRAGIYRRACLLGPHQRPGSLKTEYARSVGLFITRNQQLATPDSALRTQDSALSTSLGPDNYQLATGNWRHIGVAMGKFGGDLGGALGALWTWFFNP